MGVISFLVGAALINAGQGYFPRRVLEAADAATLFGVVLVVCLLASALGVCLLLQHIASRCVAKQRIAGINFAKTGRIDRSARTRV